MPLTAAQQAALSAAIDRLQNYYDGDNPYNPATNPGGFRQGGQVVNFEPALKDTATVMQYGSVLVADATAAAASSPKAVRVDSTQSFSADEKSQGLLNLGLSPGGGSLIYSGGKLVFVPDRGGHVMINGVLRPIPAGGIAYDPSSGGLTPGIKYYLYLSAPSSTSYLLQASTTPYVASDAYGTRVMQGDPSRTMVGMFVALTASSVSVNTLTSVGFRSFYNDPGVSMQALAGGVFNGPGNAGWALLTASIEMKTLLWAGEVLEAEFDASTAGSGAAANYATAFALDGSVVTDRGLKLIALSSAGVQDMHLGATWSGLSEGPHSLSIANQNVSNTGTVQQFYYSAGLSAIALRLRSKRVTT